MDCARKNRGVEMASGARLQSGAASDWDQASSVDWSASRAAYFSENGPGVTSNTAATREGFRASGGRGRRQRTICAPGAG